MSERDYSRLSDTVLADLIRQRSRLKGSVIARLSRENMIKELEQIDGTRANPRVGHEYTVAQQTKELAHVAIRVEADKQKDDVTWYVEHVFGGGEPTQAPAGQSWYNNPLGRHTTQINNAYRESVGKLANPYAPQHYIAYRLFDCLIDPIEEWVSSDTLRRLAGGSHVTTFLKDHELRKHGYRLEKRPAPVMYRLVPREATDGA